MQFTYDSYRDLLQLLKKEKYQSCGYDNYKQYDKSVILRHDIDTSIEKTLKMAEIEMKAEMHATYFVLVSTDFYNINSKKSLEYLNELCARGADIGLHFDEKKYDINSADEMIDAIVNEKKILELSIGREVKTVSMHRPSKWVLEQDIQISGLINSYGKEFFGAMKYLSDSRMHWREDVEQAVALGNYKRLHILTHAFWYQEEEQSAHQILEDFITAAKKERYTSLEDNIRDLCSLMSAEEL